MEIKRSVASDARIDLLGPRMNSMDMAEFFLYFQIVISFIPAAPSYYYDTSP